jgi:hypothetical protein
VKIYVINGNKPKLITLLYDYCKQCIDVMAATCRPGLQMSSNESEAGAGFERYVPEKQESVGTTPKGKMWSA